MNIHISNESAKRILADMNTLSDDHLNLLGQRFQANHILQLMGITFAEYLESPAKYDRIAAHLASGGGCRVVNGEYQIKGATHAA